MKPALIVRAAGRIFGLTVNAETAGELLGLSDEAIREQCRQDVLPTLPRNGRGATWRIPTARLLEQLGIPFEIGPMTPAEQARAQSAPSPSSSLAGSQPPGEAPGTAGKSLPSDQASALSPPANLAAGGDLDSSRMAVA